MDFEEYYRKNVERHNRSQPSIRPRLRTRDPASSSPPRQRRRPSTSSTNGESSRRRGSTSSKTSAPEFLLRTEDILNATAPPGPSSRDAEVERLAHMVEKYRILLAKTAKDKRQMTGLCTKLSHEVESLRGDLSEQESSFRERLEEERRKWAAEEESRRSSWLETKTRTLKDQTIRAFQPELQKLLVRHKSEKKDLISQFEEGLRTQQTKLQDQHAEIVRQLQADFEKEREEIREHERETYLEELGRFKADFQKLKDDLEENYGQRVLQASEKARSEERTRIEALLKQKDEDRADAVKRVDERHTMSRQEEGKRFEERLQLETDKFSLERDRMNVQFEKRLREREIEVRQEMNEQLDQQVELIVKKIQEEFALKKAEVVRQKDEEVAQARRLVDQEWSQKLMAAEERIAELESQIDSRHREKETLAERVALLQDQIDANLEGANRLDTERQRYSEELEMTRERLQTEVGRQKQLRDRMTELELEQNTLKRRNEEEVSRMMSAAKTMIVKKDETIDTLLQKIKGLQRTIHSTNSMLRGTKDLLEEPRRRDL